MSSICSPPGSGLTDIPNRITGFLLLGPYLSGWMAIHQSRVMLLCSGANQKAQGIAGALQPTQRA